MEMEVETNLSNEDTIAPPPSVTLFYTNIISIIKAEPEQFSGQRPLPSEVTAVMPQALGAFSAPLI